MQEATIRVVAKVIGLNVPAFSAVEYGKLFYTKLEQAKAFKSNYGKCDAYVTISPSMKAELDWWYSNVDSQIRHIGRGNPEAIIQTGSSKLSGA